MGKYHNSKALKQYQSLGVEGALSRSGWLSLLGRVCCSLASVVWCQWILSSCLGYCAADLAGGGLGRRRIRSLLGQRLGSGHGIMGFGRKQGEEAARRCEDLLNTFIPGVFGFVLSFQSHDHLEAIQLHPVWREENKKIGKVCVC